MKFTFVKDIYIMPNSFLKNYLSKYIEEYLAAHPDLLNIKMHPGFLALFKQLADKTLIKDFLYYYFTSSVMPTLYLIAKKEGTKEKYASVIEQTDMYFGLSYEEALTSYDLIMSLLAPEKINIFIKLVEQDFMSIYHDLFLEEIYRKPGKDPDTAGYIKYLYLKNIYLKYIEVIREVILATSYDVNNTSSSTAQDIIHLLFNGLGKYFIYLDNYTIFVPITDRLDLDYVTFKNQEVLNCWSAWAKFSLGLDMKFFSRYYIEQKFLKICMRYMIHTKMNNYATTINFALNQNLEGRIKSANPKYFFLHDPFIVSWLTKITLAALKRVDKAVNTTSKDINPTTLESELLGYTDCILCLPNNRYINKHIQNKNCFTYVYKENSRLLHPFVMEIVMDKIETAPFYHSSFYSRIEYYYEDFAKLPLSIMPSRSIESKSFQTLDEFETFFSDKLVRAFILRNYLDQLKNQQSRLEIIDIVKMTEQIMLIFEKTKLNITDILKNKFPEIKSLLLDEQKNDGNAQQPTSNKDKISFMLDFYIFMALLDIKEEFINLGCIVVKPVAKKIFANYFPQLNWSEIFKYIDNCVIDIKYDVKQSVSTLHFKPSIQLFSENNVSLQQQPNQQQPVIYEEETKTSSTQFKKQ